MNRTSKWLCYVLILCMLGSMLPFALADGAEAAQAEETAKETTVTEETAPVEKEAEEPAEITPEESAPRTSR